MKALTRWMAGLHAFVGIGATVGGAAAVLNPASPLGVSVDMLRTGPFRDYFWPGLFLLVVLGLGNFAGMILLLKKAPLHGLASGALGAALVAWIVIQCLILRTVGFLHGLFFVLGGVQGLLALVLLTLEDAFPMRWARRLAEHRAS